MSPNGSAVKARRHTKARLAVSHGQAFVELLASIPAVLLFALLCMQGLAAGATHVYADNAVHAARLAERLGRDPEHAVRGALPGWARGQLRISSTGGRRRLRLSPRAMVPGLERFLVVERSLSTSAAAGERRQ